VNNCGVLNGFSNALVLFFLLLLLFSLPLARKLALGVA
jgi:hypothetical protein